MKARVNRNLLEQTSFDSGMPGGLGMIVHRFEAPGDYEIALIRDDQVVQRLPLVVAPERGEEEGSSKMASAAPGPALAPQQLTIELGQVRPDAMARSHREMDEPHMIRSGGYASFTTARRQDAAAVVVRRRGERDEEELFDSRRLVDEDIFALTMVRPGTYALSNVQTGAKGQIKVAYPTRGREPYRPPEPLTVACTDAGFYPADIDLMPAQGIIFHIRTPSRIQIELIEPDDGPEGARAPKIGGWRKRPEQEAQAETGDNMSQSAS